MDKLKAKTKYAQARALFAARKYTAALTLLDEVLGAFPDSADVAQTRECVHSAMAQEGQLPGAEQRGVSRKNALFLWFAGGLCMVCVGLIAFGFNRVPRAGDTDPPSKPKEEFPVGQARTLKDKEPTGAIADRWSGGAQQFAFSALTVCISDERHGSVAKCQVKAYSRDWPLAFPVDGFAETDSQGSCTLQLPRGNWTIVAGGGEPFNAPGSGQGLFIVRDVTLPETSLLEFSVGDRDVSIVRFADRYGRPADVDDVLAAPADLVPGCLMPHLGQTARGICRVRMDTPQPISLFLIRRPTSHSEGYFIWLEDLTPSAEIECSAKATPLSSIRFVPEPIEGAGHPLEWNLWFPRQDYERRFAHTAFRVDGPATAYTNLGFFNLVYWVYWGDEQDWRYESNTRGIELDRTSGEAVECRAGGPLMAEFRILRRSPYGLTQFLFGPLRDAFGNAIWWYFPAKSKLEIPIEVWDESGDIRLYSSVFARHQATGLAADQAFPRSAQFRVDWDLGPWGGRHVLRGKIGDAVYQYEHDVIETAHYTVHAPKGTRKKAQAWGQRIEEVHKLYTDYIGATPQVTTARHFYINPCGLHAGAKGQELFYAGFMSWHPMDPASLHWEACAYHELGHRFQHEYNLEHGQMNPGNEAVEAVGDLFMLVAIEHFHGKEYADLRRRDVAHPFFDSLRFGTDSAYPAHNLRFVMLCYLPTRFGEAINQRFMVQWSGAWARLEALGYTQEEAAAALYSALSETELTWLFGLCGWKLNTERVQAATRELRATMPGTAH